MLIMDKKILVSKIKTETCDNFNCINTQLPEILSFSENYIMMKHREPFGITLCSLLKVRKIPEIKNKRDTAGYMNTITVCWKGLNTTSAATLHTITVQMIWTTLL